jgi:membrane-associated phospholipid phosphatase
MHHPTDVLAGSTIGVLSSLAIYLVYFPSPFNSRELAVMDKAKLVYGKKDPDEGRIELALAGEAEGAGLLIGRGVEEV